MRLVAGGDLYLDLGKTCSYLSEIGEGIVLLAEGSLSKDWTLEEVAKHTENLPMTLVGTTRHRVKVVSKGVIRSAQYIHVDDPSPEMFAESDQLQDVSYDPDQRVFAIPRVCADAPEPYLGDGQARLLLVSSGGIDWEERLEELIEAHREKLDPNSLIVQCDQHHGNKFIYSLKDGQMVGDLHTGNLGDQYVVHNF